MAVTRGKSPVVLTATTDTLNASADIGRLVWYVNEIRVINGANAGDVLLLDVNGGREIFRSTGLAANATDSTRWAEPQFVDDIYVSALPSGAVVHVYYI